MLKKLKGKLIVRKAVKAEKRLQKALKQEAALLSRQVHTEYDRSVLTWNAPEYIKYKKGKLWYAIFAIIMLASTIGAYIYGSLLFALALLGFLVAYLIFDIRHPRNVKITISEIGIKMGSKVYQFSRIRAFWITYNPPYISTLSIRVHNEFMVDIEIQLNGMNPVDIHNFLSTKLPEMEGKEEGFLKGLTRLLKL